MSVDQPLPDVKSQSVTRDAFLGGRLNLEQPVHGFRAGLESVLLGASVATATGRLLDLGCGAGVAGLVALAANPGLSGVFADIDAGALAICRRNIAANRFEGRAEAIKADATLTGAQRGLPPDAFDIVIANPPFYDRARVTVAARAPGAHSQGAGDLERWLISACAAVRPGGTVMLVHRAAALADLLAAVGSRLGKLTILPLAPVPGAPASRVLIRGVKASGAPLKLLAPLAVHTHKGGGFTPPVEAALRSGAPLDWQNPAGDPK